MKANATRGSVYTIHKCILTNISNSFQINQQQQASVTDKNENAHTQAVAIKFSRRRDHEAFTFRIFLDWRCEHIERQTKQSEIIQSALCKNKFAFDQNSCGGSCEDQTNMNSAYKKGCDQNNE